MICPNCGAEIKDGSKFCNKCGFKIEVQPVAEHIENITCANCGVALAPGAKFCKRCGTPVAPTVVQEKAPEKYENSVQSEAPVCNAETTQSVEEIVQPKEIVHHQEPSKPERSVGNEETLQAETPVQHDQLVGREEPSQGTENIWDLSAPKKPGFEWKRTYTYIAIGVGAAILLLVLILILLKIKNNSEPLPSETMEETTVETVETTVETQPVIEAEAVVMKFEDHSFAFYSSVDSWEEAEQFCESQGGHLAVVDSQEENDALYAFAQSQGCDNVYIGYSDAGNEGVWEWAGGETSGYTHWQEGEPNAYTEDENYAVIGYQGYWYDTAYIPSEGIFVCEWDCDVIGTVNIDASELPVVETVEEPVIYDEPVQVPLDQLPEFEQLSTFVRGWDEDYDCNAIPDYVTVYNMLTAINNDSPQVGIIFSSLFSDITEEESAFDGMDPMGYGYTFRIDSSFVNWAEINILNMSESDMERINGAVPFDPANEPDPWIYMSGDGYYYYQRNFAANPVQSCVQDAYFDGQYYYIQARFFVEETSELDAQEWYRYYTMELKNIDGRDYWTLISSSLTSNIGTGSSDWAEAYAAMVHSVSCTDFDDQWGYYPDGSIVFGLAYIDGDDIPELIACDYEGSSASESEYASYNVYTYVNGGVVCTGTISNAYTWYNPTLNQLSSSDGDDQMGAVRYYSYYSLNEDHTLLTQVSYASSVYDMTAYDWPESASDDFDYFYMYDADYNLIPISEDEFNNGTYYDDNTSVYLFDIMTSTADGFAEYVSGMN